MNCLKILSPSRYVAQVKLNSSMKRKKFYCTNTGGCKKKMLIFLIGVYKSCRELTDMCFYGIFDGQIVTAEKYQSLRSSASGNPVPVAMPGDTVKQPNPDVSIQSACLPASFDVVVST